MKVAVIGAEGLLGRTLVKELVRHGVDTTGLSRYEADVADEKAVLGALKSVAAEIVFNCAAYTDVDKAESEPERAFAVNSIGAANVAHACKQIRAMLIHMSTDYVFDGRLKRAYKENDTANPIQVYGKSKLEGEKYVRQTGCAWLIVRTQALFGPEATKKDFVDKLVDAATRLGVVKVVEDQVTSPTYTPFLANALVELAHAASKLANNVLHISGSKSCTWYEFAEKILESVQLEGEVVPVSSSTLGNAASRPARSVLDCTKFSSLFGSELPGFEEGIKDLVCTGYFERLGFCRT